MASDRGTMHRGISTGVDHQQASWAEPTAPTSRRLPGAPRERKPALAALAVVLILGGALAVGYLMLNTSKRVAAIEISQPIGQGQQIALADMKQVEIAADSGISYVPWSEAGQVTRFFAGTSIPSGTLLTNNMVVRTNTLTNGRSVMGLALKDGQLPAGLVVGDHINIYEVSDATESCPGTPGSLLSGNAVVLNVGTPSATSSSAVADVEVALNPATAGAVACNASNGILGVAIAPGNSLAPGAGNLGAGNSTGSTPGTTQSQKATTGASAGAG
jgi:hypothetical protein